jgi:hypothetical protein
MFHLAVNRVQSGPFSEADVRERLARGEVRGDDLCWREGWESWRKVSEVFPPLEPPVLQGCPPPLPRAFAPTVAQQPPQAGRDQVPTCGLATGSLVCGICMFVLFPLFFLLGPAAVILGHLAHSKIKRSAGSLGGSGLATAGLLLGYIGGTFMLLLVSAIAIPAFVNVRHSSQDQVVRNHLTQLWVAAEQQLLETGAEAVTYEQLVGPDKSIQETELKPVAGEDYHGLVIRRGDESLSITLGDGRTVDYYADSPAGGSVGESAPATDSDTSTEPEVEAAPQDEQPAPAGEPEDAPAAAEPDAPAAKPEAQAACPALG